MQYDSAVVSVMSGLIRGFISLSIRPWLLVVAGIHLVVSAAIAQITVTASDGFSYVSGSLNGANGGSGWSSAWTWTYGSGASMQVQNPGLSYAGLTTSGGKMVWGAGGNGISQIERSLPAQESGIIYIRFLAQFGSSSGGGTPNLRLTRNGVLTGGIGGNGGTYGSEVSILNASLQPLADGTSGAGSLANLNGIVVKIDYTARATSLWLNPTLATFNYLSPGAPDAFYANLAPAFDKVAFYSRSPASIDELSIMKVAVPEPAGCSIAIGLGLLVVGGMRRRFSWWKCH